MTAQPLARVTSLKVKLGLLVAASVTVASAVATLGSAGGVPVWLSIPVRSCSPWLSPSSWPSG